MKYDPVWDNNSNSIIMFDDKINKSPGKNMNIKWREKQLPISKVSIVKHNESDNKELVNRSFWGISEAISIKNATWRWHEPTCQYYDL